jgi:hypothetical protein
MAWCGVWNGLSGRIKTNFFNPGRRHRNLVEHRCVRCAAGFGRSIASVRSANFWGDIVRVLRGQAFNKAHAHLRESVGDFSKAIQIGPNFIWAYIGRGSARHALNENDKALDDLAMAI